MLRCAPCLVLSSLFLLACAPGPEGLKAVRVGLPAERGLGSFGVDPGGRVFVAVGQRVWELTGSIEDDTQAWASVDAFAGAEVWWSAPGFGARARTPAKEWASLTRPDARRLPVAALSGSATARLLLVEPDGTALGSLFNATASVVLARLPPGATDWQVIDGTGQPDTLFSSAWRVDDGRVFAAHGSRVFELPPGLTTATVAYDCNTRELGSCGSGASVSSFLRPLPDGRLVLLVRNPQSEVYAFRPGDAKLTRLASLGLGAAPINEQVYAGAIQGLAVDAAGTVYVTARTEQSGGELHLLAHRLGARDDEWVTAVTGLPRVMTFLQDDAGTMWLWDSSDSLGGLFKVIPKTATCKVCGE